MKVFSTISLVASLCGFLLTFAISFQAVGLSQGLKIGEAKLEEYRIQNGEEIIHFSGQGFETYDRVAFDYGNASLLFLVIAVLSLVHLIFTVHLRLLVPICSVVTCALIANILRYQLRDKTFIEEEAFILNAPRNAFLRLTITYDWVLVSLVSVIAISGILAVIWSYVRDRYAAGLSSG